ncbi:MAG TPA: FAD-linked oxidase C-terminal domain-containing protein [Alphaproteobacteria bacterium]|jgi:D-lactate dehydrogenase (cytochrome)|nr:FAD-linked oxidase C-terminal domain-containing protein [Alphaproteobacteria bacterium]MDP6271291.1 FAD-linked oxidase C-terminal domain-containing protein [Alphaproteobacteria bacterium]MDP7164067.1 FAD-linked oxidase C-terminal domain-containing protein [Alphaproteobacteria bacterium]MDP7427498.1 FAD-linked oxidase C-terminal domain-containing protein [Alphaproteobacteria bacterium]HJM49159.1 FAD-linked oxidase C-terminal domain-containing protein [Alphaproteobacteria bacterium]
MNDAARNDTTIDELRALLGDRLSTSAAVREHHGQDLSYHEAHAPDAVAFPVKADEVEAIVGICAKYQTPIVPFGAGTSLEGHVAALKGGVSIDFAEMNAIIEVNADDMDVRVEPGVLRKQLNEHLRDTGLFFPIDPGADASIGGMAATRASGTNAVRYGTMRENVLALEVVLPDGRRIRTSRRARKSAAGYDLTRLYVGSEGTLGVFTEITLKLYGIPEAITAAVCSFPDVASAVQAVIKTIQYGIPVARIELLDEVQIKASNAYSKLDLTVAPTLFLEFHGSEAGAAEQAENVQAIAAEHGGGDFQWTAQAEDRSRLWQARHDAAYASMAYRPGCKVWATDVCVPISRLAECIAETQADVAQASMPVPLVGHVGDGNFHLAFLLDPDQPAEWEEAKAINGRLIERALEMEGTCSGEHGVGSGKIDYLEAEHGEALEVMRALKRTLDPDNLMNPGKMVRV